MWLLAFLFSCFQVIRYEAMTMPVVAEEAKAKLLVPALTGPHKVGTTVLELVDYSRQDPFAPTPGPRDLVVSLFYPTDKNVKNCKLAPQFPPATAAALDVQINNPGAAEMITTRSCLNSPMARPDLPLLLLGPGLGTTRLFHSDMAGEIASHGWNVVTVDHPYDSLIVEYPDGRVVFPADSPTANGTVDDALLLQFLDARVKDMQFVLNSLSNSSVTSQIPGLGYQSSSSRSNNHSVRKSKLRTDKVGVFGHSFGGAAALQLLKDDKRFHVGADLDGGVYGTVVKEGTDSPFLFIRAPGHTHITDPSWADAWPNLRGFKREYSVNGTVHGSFTDLPIFRDLVGPEGLGDYADQTGTIGGSRLLKIETALLGALFDRFLKGHGGELLDGKGLSCYPEVTRYEY
ncbi:platelet-activating factor acetylhydrolase [Xylaria bambusicola]|uniref:platelet-activating factor acetylhydrolase n=1 Tax=Xylaria bambusicola TaxID=326684 RepID=UPI002007BA3D|nr:platelet-activating factor acetylhydrolase [Xylaria bambusicola]KAI0509409.1 platelet-activating factor acetylhydrolase [Xylaria bambusicola]